MFKEVGLVQPEHHDHLEEHHDVETWDSATKHHGDKEGTCDLGIPDLKLELIAGIHLLVVFLEHLAGLLHIS